MKLVWKEVRDRQARSSRKRGSCKDTEAGVIPAESGGESRRDNERETGNKEFKPTAAIGSAPEFDKKNSKAFGGTRQAKLQKTAKNAL